MDDHQAAIEALVAQLDRRGEELGIDDASFTRLTTAVAAQILLLDLAAAEDDLARVEVLAAARVPTALTMAKSISTARSVADELEAAQFEIIIGAMQREEGAALRADLVAAMTADEFVTPLAPVLRRVQQEAVKLLTDPVVALIDPPLPPPLPGVKEELGLSLEAAQTRLAQLAEDVREGTVDEKSVEVTVRWTEREADAAPDGGAE